MTHQRIRTYNRYRDKGEGPDIGFCAAVRANDTVYLRGLTGLDLDDNIVGESDPAAQADNAMKCAKILLEEAGSRLEDIVKVTIYTTKRENREPVYQAIGKWIEGVHPASTGLIVDGLGRPEFLMEIDIVAVIPRDDG